MVDKLSGQVAYAVMSFGGFLGIGEKYHPLSSEVLDYDERLDGHVVNLDKEPLCKCSQLWGLTKLLGQIRPMVSPSTITIASTGNSEFSTTAAASQWGSEMFARPNPSAERVGCMACQAQGRTAEVWKLFPGSRLP